MPEEQEPTIENLMTGKKQFKVVYWYTEGGAVFIKADNAEEAEKKVYDFLDYHGHTPELQEKAHFDCSSREYDVIDSEDMEGGEENA